MEFNLAAEVANANAEYFRVQYRQGGNWRNDDLQCSTEADARLRQPMVDWLYGTETRVVKVAAI